MSVDDALTLTLRRDEAARHNATVTIHRVTTSSFDDTVGTYSDTTASVYSGACLLLPVPAQEETPEYGGEDVNTRRYKIQLAANTDARPDDIATVNTASLDDDLVGKVMTVVDVEYSSRQVSRNLICLHNVGG